MKFQRKYFAFPGQQFGRLTVINVLPKNIIVCKCLCGKQSIVTTAHLFSGATKSCGCLRVDATQTHGMSKKTTYKIWQSMKLRCSEAATGKSRKNYYEKGIRVCEKWQDFRGFLEDMGARPDGMSIDRIDNDKSYFKANCRWSTRKQQANNTTRNIGRVRDGAFKTAAEIADLEGLPYTTVHYRIKAGLSEKDVLSKNKLKGGKKEIILKWNDKSMNISDWSRHTGINYGTMIYRINKYGKDNCAAIFSPVKVKNVVSIS